jgi:hypothetical protein
LADQIKEFGFPINALECINQHGEMGNKSNHVTVAIDSANGLVQDELAFLE